VRMPDAPVTLAEILRGQGYRTGAVVSGWTLRDAQCGLGQGFETYDDAGMDERYKVVNLMRRADAVTDSAIRWFDQGAAMPGRPWFLFVHYFDPHEPYDLPIKSPLADNPARKDLPRATVHSGMLPAYDNEIAYADAQLGRLLDHLRERGALKDTLIVFTADHGQSFGDNGYGGPEGEHGRKVYQTQVAVPLVMHLPGRIAASRSALPVSHLDILPTIAELLGLPVSVLPAGLPGASLAKVAADPSAPPPWGRARRTRHGLAFRGAVGNKWNIFRWMQNKNVEKAEPLCAYVLTDDGRKVIVDFAKKNAIEVYDLRKDPCEQVNLAGQAVPVDVARSAGEEIFAWYDRTRNAELSAPAPSAEDLEKLRSLGYVGN
jgi:arylsulfatase A-like enzyme